MRLYGTLQELSSLTIRLDSGKTVQVVAAEPTVSATVTIPDVVDGADTFVVADTAQTLLNKTLTAPVMTAANISASNLVIPKLSDPAVSRAQGSLILDSDTNLVTVGDTDNSGSYKVLVDETSAQTMQNKSLSSPNIAGGTISGSVLGSDLNPVTISFADKIALGKIADVSAGHVLISDANNEVYSEAQLNKSRGGTGADLSNVSFPANVASTIVTDIAELTSVKLDRAAPSIATNVLTPSSDKEVIQRIATAANFNEIANPEDGRYYILMNASATDITIGNETGTAANQIVTGTGAAFTFKAGTSIAAVYDGGSTKWRLSGGAGGAGGGTADVISQVAHGFVVGDALYLSGSTYTKAIATAANTAEVVGVVSKVVSSDTFELTTSGEITNLSGLTPGGVYFLSSVTAGLLTLTEPSVVGYVSLPIGVASSASSLYVAPKRGVVVGAANLRTQIGLSENAATNIQKITSYDAGELAGWVDLNATADYKFYVQAQFVKNAAGAWNISYQTTGDTPPAGFNMDIITSGPDAFIQVSLPAMAGYVNGKINFALNAPAVGTSLPLSVDASNLVSGTIDSARLPLATSSAQGAIAAGIQGANAAINTSQRYKASVKGSANLSTGTIEGSSTSANLVSVAFAYRYDNNNGTSMTTRPTIVIKDTTSNVTIVTKSNSVVVPSGYDSRLESNLTVILPPVTGTTYTVECYELNAGGGSYEATDAHISVSSSKLIL